MKNIYKISALLIIILLIAAGLGKITQPARAAVGFHISGRNLLDANGNNFIIRGISHPHVWYQSQSSSFANIKAAGANTVRVVLGGGRWGPNSATDVANVIGLCRLNKLICVLEDHDTTGYAEDAAATSLATAVNYWKSIQSVLTGQEAWVIINIGNEPYGNTNAANWVADTKNAIIAMRAAGFEHTLMVDAPNWGQDWAFVMRDNAASVFAADSQANTIFSIHMYGVFDTAAEITSYVSAFKTANLPLVIGEFGHNHSDGNPDEDTIMSTSVTEGIGYMGWSWSGNGSGVEYLDMVTSFDPAQLTTWGQRFINGANGLSTTSVECSVYDGVSQPTYPAPTATIGVTVPPGSTSLALNKTATASSNEDGTTLPSAAFDGSLTTRWASTSGTDPQWLQVDLGSPYNITYMVLRWEAAYATGYQIQLSNDATTWTTVYSTTTGDGSLDTVTINGAGRYVRMNGTARYGATWGYSLYEMEVYGNTGTPAPSSTPTKTFTPSLTPTITQTRTRTLTPTITSTPTVTSTSTPVPTINPNEVLKVQLFSPGTDNTSQATFNFSIQNSGTTAISGLEARVYFTLDGGNAASSYMLEKYYDQSGVATLGSPVQASGNIYYIPVNYGTTALAAGATWQFHTNLHLTSWASTLNSGNDWWHTGYAVGALPTAYTPTNFIPVFINGSLAAGLAPGVTGPTNTPGTPNTPTRTSTPVTPTITSTPTLTPVISLTPTRTLTPVITNTLTLTPVITNTLTRTLTPAITNTSTRTSTAGPTATRTRTPTAGVSLTPTRTPTVGLTNTPTLSISPTITPTVGGACSPVTSTITAPFTYDGAGTFCWQSTNLGAYINSWNTTNVSVNGINHTNVYVAVGSLPAKINGYWYVSYNSTVSYGHFEAK